MKANIKITVNSIVLLIFCMILFSTSISFAQDENEIILGKIVKLNSKILNEERVL